MGSYVCSLGHEHNTEEEVRECNSTLKRYVCSEGHEHRADYEVRKCNEKHHCSEGHGHNTSIEVLDCNESRKRYICSVGHKHHTHDGWEICRKEQFKKEENKRKEKIKEYEESEKERNHVRKMEDHRYKMACKEMEKLEFLSKHGYDFKRHGLPDPNRRTNEQQSIQNTCEVNGSEWDD